MKKLEKVDLENATWRKSSLSGGGDCVEVAIVKKKVAVRDTKNRQGPVLIFTEQEWRAFLGGVNAGEFNLS